MNDAIVFAFGAFVSLVVLAACALLMWGAAQEPAPGEAFEEDGAEASASSTGADRATAAPLARRDRKPAATSSPAPSSR